MELATVLVAVVVTVLVGTVAANRLGVPSPLLLTVLGVAIAYTPFIPDLEITADLVLVGLLPPLLYAAALRTSLIDLRANRRVIGLLSVGLVVFTTLGVGVVAHALLPIPWAAAFALGAVVAPPDAVAATAIARRVRMPRRVVTILEGESLVNDATALVCLRTATAALGSAGAAADGRFDGTDVRAALGVLLDFAWAAGGGVAIGLAVAAVLVQIRRRVTDTVSDTAISLVAPWLAYLPAEELHLGDVPASGVLAVVVTGIVLGHKAPVVQSAASRISERTYWRTLAHLLENAVFLLIGLQAFRIVADVGRSELSTSTIVIACVAVLLTAVLLRPLWVFPVTYLPGVVPRDVRAAGGLSWQYPAVVSWAGMRGVVTLAAVFTLPPRTPHREVLVLIALVVTAGTLLVQGSTLPWAVRRLGLRGPDPMEDRLQEAAVLEDASAAGLRALDAQAPAGDPDGVAAFLRQQTERRTHFAWERLGRASASADSPLETSRRLRRTMLDAERGRLLALRDSGSVPHEVLQHVLAILDVEESVLAGAEDRDEDLREETPMTVPELPGGGCEHLDAAPSTTVPRSPGACQDCVAEGTSWVHLRMCLTCGQVGCCDSSPQRHASRHYATTHDPVIRSVEPGESWRWCYVDEQAG